MNGAVIYMGFIRRIQLAIGVFTSGAIFLPALDLPGLQIDLLAWILTFMGAVIGVINIQRYKEWASIALATLVGALFLVCGIQKLMQLMQGLFGTLLILVLAGVSFAYRGGFFKVAKPATQ